MIWFHRIIIAASAVQALLLVVAGMAVLAVPPHGQAWQLVIGLLLIVLAFNFMVEERAVYHHRAEDES